MPEKFEEIKKEPLLLHVCCAPCASGCVPRLEDRKIILFFSNSNLGTRAEFELRLANVRILAEHYGLPLMVDPYDHASWLNSISSISDYERLPEHGARCTACFAWSLGRTARKAEELGMHFATTLTVSPYKSSRVIFSIGGAYPHFEALDFKKKDGYLLSLKNSRLLGLYRQNYCGCEFSFAEAETRKTLRQSFGISGCGSK